MCMTCNCGVPTDDHGDQRNITIKDLQEAAEAQKVNLGDVFKSFIRTIPVVVKNWRTYSASSEINRK